MQKLTRRNVLCSSAAFAVPASLATLITGCDQPGANVSRPGKALGETPGQGQTPKAFARGGPMKIQYLEIVTPDVDALCRQYGAIYDMTFGPPEDNLGGARTAQLADGGMIGIRGPLRDTETPIVRPYMLVDQIQEAVEAAESAGAKVAMPPTELPEYGTFAIVIQGGIECGLWERFASKDDAG